MLRVTWIGVVVGLASACAALAQGKQGGFPAFPAAPAPMMAINCAIRPLQVVEIAAPKSGVIRDVFVRPGQEVEKGAKIAVFDDDLDRATLAAAEARAMMKAGVETATVRRDRLTEKVERMEKAAKRGAVAQADLEAAQLELALAQSDVKRETDLLALAEIEAEQARTILGKSVVVSPVAGVVGEDPIDPGESPAQKPIAVIYVVNPLRVEAYVPTAVLAEFLARDRFDVVVNGDSAAPIPVIMDHVSQVADLSSNTQSVFFTLEAPGILPGYKCMFEG